MSHRPFNVCEHCGKPKTKYVSHAKCSRILQRKHAAQRAAQPKASKRLRADTIEHVAAFD